MTEKVWLSSYPEGIPHTLDFPQIPVQQFLTEAAQEVPEKVALHFMGKEMTYKELHQSALKFAN